jgi:hypothetical protein
MHTHSQPTSAFTIRFVVPHKLDCELAWFVEKNAHGATGAPLPADPSDPDQVWERIAYDVIGRWLRAIDAYDASVLRCAYAPPKPAPPRLEERLGRLSPVVARLAGGEPGWPDAIDWRVMKRHTRTAAEILRAAVRAYARERGRGPCMVYRAL